LVKIPTSPYNPHHRLEKIARLAFYATLILAPFRLRTVLLSRPNDDIYRDYTDFLLFLPDVAMLVTLFAWGLARRFEIKTLRLGPAYVWIPLVGLTLAALLSSISSVDSALSFYHSIRLCALFLVYLYVVNEQTSTFLISLAAGLQGALQSVVGIAQSLTQRSVGLQALGEYSLDPAWSGVSIVSDGTSRFLRAYGLTDHPNILGGCLAFSLLILLTAYLRSEGKHLFVTGFAFALLSLALLMTFSRSAWLALSAGAIFIIVLEVKARGWASLKSVAPLFVLTALVLIPFVVMNSTYFAVRLNLGDEFENVRTEEQAVDERAYLNQIANKIFTKFPLTGVGMSASPVAIKSGYGDFPTNYQPPHFALLAVALETGFFGSIFYFLLMFLPWVAFSRRADLRVNPRAIGVMGLLLALTVVGFFDYYIWFSTPGRLWQWLAWGLFATAIESPSPREASPKGTGRGVRGEGELR